MPSPHSDLMLPSRRAPSPLAISRSEGEAAVRLVLAALAAGIAVAAAVIWRSLV